MKIIQVNLPNEIAAEEKNLLLLFASFLYEKGKVSLGQAAEIAGVSKRTFVEVLGLQNVSVFNFSVEDLKKDVSNA